MLSKLWNFSSFLEKLGWISSNSPQLTPSIRYPNCQSGLAVRPEQNLGVTQEVKINNKQFFFSAAILLLALGALAEETNWCSSSNTHSLPLNQAGVQLHVLVPKGIVFTWDSVPSGNQMNIEVSEHISLSTQKIAGNVTITPEMVFVVGISISWTFVLSYCNSPSVHVRFPMKFISEVCINEENCIPTTCDLGFFSLEFGDYSKVSASNKNFFEDNDCKLKKPAFWDQWVSYHFNFNTSDEEFYYIDSDNDGLINILEYYSNGSTPEQSTESVGGLPPSMATIGSNPLNPDSDSDLLLDGFEAFFGLSPIEADDSSADADNDSLTNLQEQIFGSDPFNKDSDGDGVTDGIEAEEQGTFKDFAMIRLTIGDPTSSEKYILHAGDISHHSPGFGVVGSGTYKFGAGRYAITVQWVASIYSTPDYDYTAEVSKESGEATVIIEDPNNILGTFYDSYFDRTVGKEATLIVEGECSDEASDEIYCIDTCEECQSSPFRIWNSYRDRCQPYSNISIPDSYCPCTKCEKWYQEELADRHWLEDLNSERPCPCQARSDGSGLTSANEMSEINWRYDWVCRHNSKPSCSDYHPGAFGCMKADWKSYRQQCCYDTSLNWITSASPGAGTPNKENFLPLHVTEDVFPFKWCCKQCKDQKYCDYYLGQEGVRTGPTTCSNDA